MGLNTCFRKQTLPVMKEIQLQNNSKTTFIICGQSLLPSKETLSAGYVAAGLLQVILPLIKLTLRIKRRGKIPKTMLQFSRLCCFSWVGETVSCLSRLKTLQRSMFYTRYLNAFFSSTFSVIAFAPNCCTCQSFFNLIVLH